MRHDKFEDYLRTEFSSRVTGKPMSPRAVGSCLSRLKRVEKVLSLRLTPETFTATRFHSVVADLAAKVAQGEMPNQGHRDCIVSLRHYLEFSQVLRGEAPSSETYAYAFKGKASD